MLFAAISYVADRTGTIITTIFAGIFALVGCFVMWLALHGCSCGGLCTRRGRTPDTSHLGDVALTDLGRARAATASSPLAATIQIRKKAPTWKQWLATIIFVATLVVMAFTYLSWGAGSSIVNADVARISRAVSLQLAAGVNEFTRAATELVDTEIGAFERRELPITDADLLDRTQTAALEAFMYDLYTVYSTSRTPVGAPPRGVQLMWSRSPSCAMSTAGLGCVCRLRQRRLFRLHVQHVGRSQHCVRTPGCCLV